MTKEYMFLVYRWVKSFQNSGSIFNQKIQFKTDNINLIISDINMPNMNGLELVKKVRSEGTHQKTPIIMITTEGGKGEVITALKAGVNNYIVKPFSAEVLKEKLDGVLKK